jgi:peptidoglycan/xylan/chitin deacetylase (PgdA/CDA1 family)
MAVVHVDLDGASDIFVIRGWTYHAYPDTLFETGLRRCLDLFDRQQIRATFFLIAASLRDPRKRALVAEAAARGHEIASHSVTHRLLTTLDRADKRREVADSRTQIEQDLGIAVSGFRAPGYQIDRECYELLAESGYAYDASAFPTAAFATALHEPIEQLVDIRCPVAGSPFAAIPMPDHRPWPVPFGPSYVLTLDQVGAGLPYFRAGLRRLRRMSRPFVLLFHLADFADPLPPDVTGTFRRRLFTLSTVTTSWKIDRCVRMLEEVRRHYQIVPTETLLASRTGARGNV